jgi:hypothetical protein
VGGAARRCHLSRLRPNNRQGYQFDKFVVDETEKWAKEVKFSGAKVD